MWTHNSYRVHSPGADTVEWFLSKVKWTPGDTIIDLGCGTGRAGEKLASKGLQVRLLDFCKDAVEVDLPFTDACLWSLPPGLPRFDWIYCADVLEHIPREYLGKVFDSIASLTIRGGYIQVATAPDGCGKIIGETLHLTVEPSAWWYEQIKLRWNMATNDDEVVRNLARARFIIGEPYA